MLIPQSTGGGILKWRIVGGEDLIRAGGLKGNTKETNELEGTSD